MSGVVVVSFALVVLVVLVVVVAGVALVVVSVVAFGWALLEFGIWVLALVLKARDAGVVESSTPSARTVAGLLAALVVVVVGMKTIVKMKS